MLDDKCVGAPTLESRERQLPVDWIEERFRVDRRKLEEMILGKSLMWTRLLKLVVEKLKKISDDINRS